ncbi:uncharacterized protein [Diadema setosum]|uniref:uncharacterized protein n=1 Tax=Diadema setosum TaxID=31175 RepID=UPI003B3A0174
MSRRQPKQTPGVRGTVIELTRSAAVIGLEGYNYHGESAWMNCSVMRRGMDAKVEDLTNFMRIGDRVIMVIEKMSDVPARYQRGTSKWNVFDARRDITTPRPAAFPSPASYMVMATNQLYVYQSLGRVQTAELLVSIRQILSVWNVVDLVTFINLWRLKSTGFSADENSLRGFVNDCLTGVYCEFSGGKLQLYQGFDEEEIRIEMKWRFATCREQQPRKRGIIDSIVGALVVESPAVTNAILDSLLKKAASNQKVVVGVDCEGVHLGRYGSLTLLQLATMDGHVYIFDIQKNPDLLRSGQLRQLLEDPKIIKVIHDCRNDTAALKAKFNIQLAGVFDTSVAYSTIMEQCNKIGKPYRIGQKALCSALGEDTTFKDDAIFERMTSDKQLWARRPLTVDMKNYAAADPVSLVPHVYQALDGMISPFWRDYFDAKCKDALKEL